jgi:NAD(P)-dependent dehydrogenase (short-subunit alcohol dehydrogenase family)
MAFSIDLTGRRALVTGAGRHTGRRFSLALAQAGAEVAVNDIVVDAAEAVAAEIRAAGGAAVATPFDVTSYDDVAGAVRSFEPDILVNNTGATGAIDITMPRFVDTEPASWRPLVDINLYGTLNCTHNALPAMRRRGWGRIITIVSDASRKGDPGLAVYAASKAASAGFMRTIAAEVGRDGITANCLSFGTLAYEHMAPMPDDRAKAMLRGYAIRRFGTPDDPVGVLVMLASDHGSWITGQTIPVNGGYSNAL